jgi:hypothetical protein
MSEINEQPTAPSSKPVPSDTSAADNHDPRVELKKRLEETRLPANLKEQIVAQLPPPEERERLFKELREKGGLTSDEFFASLGLADEQQP